MSLRTLTLFSLLFANIANANLVDQYNRKVWADQQSATLAKLHRHFDMVDQRFMVNLESFMNKYGGFQSQPTCTSSDDRSWGSSSRTLCRGSLCVSVSGYQGGREKTDDISVEVYRRAEMVRNCLVVLRNGLQCSVGYLHSQKDAWMVGFGGTCTNGSQGQTYSVPFRNIKW